MIISNIIATLPSSFGVFDTMWHGIPHAEKTMVNLMARLSEKERKLNKRSNGVPNHQDVAFYASHPSRVKKSLIKNDLATFCNV
jgi:hypothetical protein